MKITKLDGRFTANRRWGYQYAVTFLASQWKKYFEFKRKAEEILGPGLNSGLKFYFRDDSVLLKSNTWAYKYVKISKETAVYFRTEEDMNQVVLMYALTATV